MKTIEIQNCTGYRDSMFKVFINGEKHVVRFQRNIQVSDNQPFEIKAKYFWGGSPKYKFEPKDNVVLQVSVNQHLRKILFIGLVAVVMKNVVKYDIGYSILNEIIVYILLLSTVAYFIIRRSRAYIIREIKREQND